MSERPLRPRDALLAPERELLAAGRHAELAQALAAGERHALAAWVLEQIWDFAGACEEYLVAGAGVDALRVGLESGRADLVDAALASLEAESSAPALRAAATLLGRRGRHADAARMLAAAGADPQEQAGALLRGGERAAAARVLAATGDPRGALAALDLAAGATAGAPAHALAAEQSWALGDAEGTARHAQAARRAGNTSDVLRGLLARSLSSLGHDLAAQIVLGDAELPAPATASTARGRYKVTGVLPAPYCGAAYVGLDRLTLQEVEIHLLLAEYSEHERPGPEALAAVADFLRTAEQAAALAHPAIRPVLRVQAEVGLLVLPRSPGFGRRELIRPPGLLGALARARSLIAFLLEGVAVAHARGLVHGGLFPSRIHLDALGRPVAGPFGAHHLAGLEATRTGGLEELLVMSAPEVARGDTHSQASDLYAAGVLYSALLHGRLQLALAGLPAEEAGLIASMTAADPAARPAASEVVRRLRVAVADASDLGRSPWTADTEPAASTRSTVDDALTVTATGSWSDAALDALCAARDPWLQPILDRQGRRFVLAAWPPGSRRLDERADWRDLLDARALAHLEHAPPVEAGVVGLRAEVVARLDARSLVATPSGEWMIALDDLLTR